MRLAKCGNTTALSIDVHTLRADPHQTTDLTDLTRPQTSLAPAHVLIIHYKFCEHAALRVRVLNLYCDIKISNTFIYQLIH